MRNRRMRISESRINAVCQQVLREAIGDPIDNKENALRMLNSIYHALGADAQQLRGQFEQLYQAIESLGAQAAGAAENVGNGGYNGGGNGGYDEDYDDDDEGYEGRGGGYAGGGNGGGGNGGYRNVSFSENCDVPEDGEQKTFTFTVTTGNGGHVGGAMGGFGGGGVGGGVGGGFVGGFGGGIPVGGGFRVERDANGNVVSITVVASSLEEAQRLCMEEIRRRGLNDVRSVTLESCEQDWSAYEDIDRGFTNGAQPTMSIDNGDSIEDMYAEVMRKLRSNTPCKFVFRKVDGSVRPAVGTLNRNFLNTHLGEWQAPENRYARGRRADMNFNQNYFDLTDGEFKRFNPTRLLAVY